MRKYKLGDIATVEISGVDKKIKDGEKEIRLCNFVDVYYNWAITTAQHDGFMLATASPNEISKFQLKKGQVALTKDSETRDDIGIPTYIADDFDDAIVRYMRKKHNLLIGERTAEDIKIKVGSAYPKAEVTTMNVRGRNLVTGLPKTVEVSSEETEEALREATSQIVEAVHSVLEKTPPELASDIADRGIVLTGGGSLLSGLEDLIEAKTGINTMTAEDPMTCVAIGTGKFIEFLAGYRDEVK